MPDQTIDEKTTQIAASLAQVRYLINELVVTNNKSLSTEELTMWKGLAAVELERLDSSIALLKELK